MNSTDARGYPTDRPDRLAGTHSVPASCPVCQSTSIVTKSKNPDENSYWRCTNCGEIWNVSRFHRTTGGGGPWR